jgi:hypothetical protein
MPFLEYYMELVHRFPTLSPILAQRLVNRARSDVYSQRRWSFLLAEGVLTVPSAITSGTVTVEQNSATVTPDSTALTALNAAGATPLLGKRQFSLGTGSPIYNIADYDGATITLDRPYRESDLSGSSYQVFCCYFDPPSTDFVSFIAVKDIQNSYNLRLNFSYREMNRFDPQRATVGDPLYIASYIPASDGTPRFELWPHPSTAKSYHCLYQRRGEDFTLNTESLPSVVPEALLMERACYYAYQWAMQTGQMPQGKAVDWRFLMQQSSTEYKDLLRRTAREDNEAYEEMYNSFSARSGYLSPIDTNYAQNHAVGLWSSWGYE